MRGKHCVFDDYEGHKNMCMVRHLCKVMRFKKAAKSKLKRPQRWQCLWALGLRTFSPRMVGIWRSAVTIAGSFELQLENRTGAHATNNDVAMGDSQEKMMIP